MAEEAITDEDTFDELVELMANDNPLIAMRASDAAEKASRKNKEFVKKHKKFLLDLLEKECRQEVYWHLAMMIPRTDLTKDERLYLFTKFENWFEKDPSRIVRVCSLQALYELSDGHTSLNERFQKLHAEALSSPIPSISARARRIAEAIKKS